MLIIIIGTAAKNKIKENNTIISPRQIQDLRTVYMIIIADLARGYYKKMVMITGRYGKRRNVPAHVLSESYESINLHFLYGKDFHSDL